MTIRNPLVLVALAAAIFAALGIGIWAPGDPMTKLKVTTGYTALILIFVLGVAVLLEIASGRMDLSQLLSEIGGGASMSRFQLLIFTFVIGLSFFLIVAETGKFPAVPAEVLTLLGISASTYAVSKGITASARTDSSKAPPPSAPSAPPSAAPKGEARGDGSANP
jgi:hypothetical protein